MSICQGGNGTPFLAQHVYAYLCTGKCTGIRVSCFKHTIMDSETQKIMEDNKKVIESLLRIIMLRIIMLCGKQGLALRGQ